MESPIRTSSNRSLPRPAQRWAALSLLCLSAACSRESAAPQAPAAAAAPVAVEPAAPTATAEAAGFAVQGEVDSLRLQALSELPAAPKAAADAEADPDCAKPPGSEEARAAAKQGWRIVEELTWKDYRVLGVAAAPARAAGIGCMAGGGRVLFFRDGRPVAQLLDPQADPSQADSGIQSVFLDDDADPSPREGAGELRIGDWATERARVQVEGAGLRLAALPETDRYCDGHAVLPRVESVALPQARERLLARGWSADVPKREGDGEFLSGLIGAGYPEIEDCSGTGQGFCSFQYRNAAGDRLRLITAGEFGPAEEGAQGTSWPTARNAQIACAGTQANAG